jgi:hypothetical protein
MQLWHHLAVDCSNGASGKCGALVHLKVRSTISIAPQQEQSERADQPFLSPCYFFAFFFFCVSVFTN